MRKTLISLLVILTLSSCADNSCGPEYPLEYIGVVSATYNDVTYIADIIYKNNLLNLVVIEPQELEGFSFTVNDEEAIVEYNSVVLDYKTEDVSKICPFVFLYDIFNEINIVQPVLYERGENLIGTFESDSGRCEVSLNKITEEIDYLKFKNIEFLFTA